MNLRSFQKMKNCFFSLGGGGGYNAPSTGYNSPATGYQPGGNAPNPSNLNPQGKNCISKLV